MSQQVKNIEAGETPNTNKQIVLIPVDKIIPNKEQNTGIRNDEKFQQLVENIKIQGLNNHILVRPLGTKYELIAGYHRVQAYIELERKTIEAQIIYVDDNKSAEMCLADNLNRIDYDPAQKEKLIIRRWKNGNYSSKKELAERIGLSDVWVGKCIEANTLRNDIKKKYPKVKLDNFSSQTILDASKIMGEGKGHDISEFAALLDIADKKKIRPSKIGKIAQELKEWPKELKVKVLFEGESFDKIKFEMQNKANQETPKAKKGTSVKVKQDNPNFIIDTYKALDGNLKSFFTTLEKSDKEKAIRYIKVMINLLGELLLEQQYITLVHYRQISDDILGVKISPHKYDGSRDLERLGKFCNSYAENLEIQSTEETNQEGT